MDTHFRPSCQIEPDNFVRFFFSDGRQGVWGNSNISNNFDSNFFFFFLFYESTLRISINKYFLLIGNITLVARLIYINLFSKYI